MFDKKMKKINMNKRGDIPIMILVVGVLILCGIAFLSFYLSGKAQVESGINSIYYLQKIYNLADSVEFSGSDLIDNYGDVKSENEKLIIEKDFLEDGEVFMKVRYTIP